MQILRELRDEKIDFWIKHNLNVLIVGHYGTGKTARILEAFKRNNLKFKYFSAATMDPWCDFIGVPKVVTDERGPYLDYVLPRDLRDDTIEAIYLDEFNRSHKKVRNAVMELLQFKSINGRPFNKLRLIWAAINPEDEGEYQVEALDKAQKDRFHVQIAVPYEPSVEYFSNKFNVKQAKAAINWWQSLPPEQQMEVSPRRLEYALQMFNTVGGSIKDVLPPSTNTSKLAQLLKTGPIDERMKALFLSQDLDKTKQFLQVENNYAIAERYFCNDIPNDADANDWKSFFLQSISTEKLSSLMSTNEEVYNFILSNYDKKPIFSRLIGDIVKTNTDKTLARRLRKHIDTNKLLDESVQNQLTANQPYFSSKQSSIPWASRLVTWTNEPMENTIQRIKIYEELIEWLPSGLSLQDAVNTVNLINTLANRSQANTLKQFRHLVGVVNHCVECIHKVSNLSWSEILSNYGHNFDKLMPKLKDNGMEKGLYRPLKNKVQTYGAAV